jgi:tryptophanyl-tRNA synthetase
MADITVNNVEGEIDYKAAMKEFGIEDITPFLPKFKDQPVMYRRGLVVGHRDIGRILHAIKGGKKFAVLTGVNPSGPLHLGNKMFLDQALYFQKLGADVYIPVSNDETHVFKKSDSLEQATKNAYDNVIPEIIAHGFDRKKTKIFVSTKDMRVYDFAVRLSTRTTFSTIKAIFGFNNDTNPGQIFYGVVQSAHILLPQLEEFGGPKPVVVPIGIDQDPYMRLSRDIAEKEGFIKPSSTNHKFLPGLQGGKMSGSKPETCIHLNEEPASARKKIMKAFSGGAGTLKEHREKGGNPDIDMACQYLFYMFEEDDRKIKDIFDGYRKGTLHSGDVKSMLADKVDTFLKDFAKKKEKAKKHMDDYMLN